MFQSTQQRICSLGVAKLGPAIQNRVERDDVATDVILSVTFGGCLPDRVEEHHFGGFGSLWKAFPSKQIQFLIEADQVFCCIGKILAAFVVFHFMHDTQHPLGLLNIIVDIFAGHTFPCICYRA